MNKTRLEVNTHPRLPVPAALTCYRDTSSLGLGLVSSKVRSISIGGTAVACGAITICRMRARGQIVVFLTLRGGRVMRQRSIIHKAEVRDASRCD